MIKKIISGGQTGADQAGLFAGKTLGLEVGGTAPPNFMTHEGSNIGLLQGFYRLKEGESDPRTYPKRTRKNVEDSDGTVIFGNWKSPGSRMTKTSCLHMRKPVIINPTSEQLRVWVDDNGIEILNVAGNREHKNPGIYDRVVKILKEAFEYAL